MYNFLIYREKLSRRFADVDGRERRKLIYHTIGIRRILHFHEGQKKTFPARKFKVDQ